MTRSGSASAASRRAPAAVPVTSASKPARRNVSANEPEIDSSSSATSKTKARVTTAATVFGLAGLEGVAISAGRHQEALTVADKPLVRTKVIRRTIRVTKHAKPKHPAVGELRRR